MARPTLSPLRRAELAQTRRAAAAQVGLFCGIGPQPLHLSKPRLERAEKREAILIAYAVALGVKRGVFASDIEASKFHARVYDRAGNASVLFFKHTLHAATIDVLNLDWTPGEVIAEELPLAA
jgi:hypothetical protein